MHNIFQPVSAFSNCIHLDYSPSLEWLCETLHCLLPPSTKVIELCDTDKSSILMENVDGEYGLENVPLDWELLEVAGALMCWKVWGG